MESDNRKRHKCEMCDKRFKILHEHHIIPWYLSHDDSESNIMKLCFSCHRKADSSFDNLILRGKISAAQDTRKRISARYNKYISFKMLYCLCLLKNTFYEEFLRYNVKTGKVGIYQRWRYMPYKYKDKRIKSRTQLLKAASAKGQATLA